MKRITLVIFLVLFLLLSNLLEANPRYSLIRFYTDDVAGIASLGLDIVKVKKGIAVEAVVPEHKMYQIEGENYEVIIADMEEYYSSKMSGREGFGDFYTFDEAYAIIDSLTMSYPELVKIRWEIGEGWRGNKIYALKISDNPEIDEDEPEVLYDACIHAREPVTVNVLVESMRTLLQNYGDDPEITFLLNNRQLYFIPILNPDGYLYNESTNPGGGGMWRKNRRSDEDDKFIRYTYGVDLNRNFPYMWGYDDVGSSPYMWDETYRGPSPASEPETQAYIQFVEEYNFISNLCYHSYGGMLLHPWGYNGELPPDYTEYYEPFAIYLTSDNNYRYGTPGDLLYNVNGGTLDWFYGEKGCYSLSPEVDGAYFWDEAAIQRNLNECIPMNIKLGLASGPYLTYKEHSVEDSEYGNGDGGIDTSETIDMPIIIENVGIFDGVSRVSGLLSTRDAYIELENALSTFGYMSEQEETVSVNPYRFSCSPDCPEGHMVPFLLTLVGNDYFSQSEFNDIVGEPTFVFFDDFEEGGGNWIWDSPWAITSSQSHSPNNSATDSPGGNYSNNWDRSMTMNCYVDLSCASYAELSFYHEYFIEYGWDYGYCEVSINGGITWSTLKGFTGQQSLWIQECISLEDYCGEASLRIRFRIDTDTYVTEDGWYIDDVAITASSPGNHAPSSPIPRYPVDGDTIYSSILVVENAVDQDGDELSYGFKVYTDSLLTNLIIDTTGIEEGIDTTICELQLPIGTYYWRSYAEDSLERGLCCFPESFTLIETGVTEDVKRSLPNIYPNPAKGLLKIDYGIIGGNPGKSSIKIYDISGRLICVISGKQNVLIWNGIDNNGVEVSSGIYYLEIDRGIRKKVIFIK